MFEVFKTLTPPPPPVFFKIPFSNKTKCIFKWQRLDYVNSEAFGEAGQLMHVSNLIKDSMVRLFQFIFLWFIRVCDLMTSTSVVLFSFHLSLLQVKHCPKKRERRATCSPAECLRKFLTCWCGFIEFKS